MKRAIVACFLVLMCGCATRTYPHAAIAADHPLASKAGVEILRKGGNAVDAAVATAFCLSVVRPQSCGIGGGGFMVIRFHNDPRFGDTTTSLNYREMCPARINDIRRGSTYGARAVGVPGSVAGLLYALDHYGTLDRATVLAPAIRIAEEGFTADKHFAEAVKSALAKIDRDARGRERFATLIEKVLHNRDVKIGDRVRVPEQAAALRLIVRDGADAFYRGEIAEAIARTVAADQGVVDARDLENFKVVETPPVKFEAFGRTFLGMPPPTAGGVALAQGLTILEMIGLREGAKLDADYLHKVDEAMKHAFADRAMHIGDPAFVDVPVPRIISREYLAERAKTFDPATTQPASRYGTADQLAEEHGTSHFCVIDARGNAVACTETINSEFGSLLVVPEFGFCLNNELDHYASDKHSGGMRDDPPLPGKRPLSSMSPTIGVGRDGNVELIVGGSGSQRIISATLQTVLNVLIFDRDAKTAVSSPRFHDQWKPQVMNFEKSWADQASGKTLIKQLESRGHKVATTQTVGNVQLIRRSKHGRGWDAASDPRKGGAPAGY